MKNKEKQTFLLINNNPVDTGYFFEKVSLKSWPLGKGRLLLFF